MFYEIKLKVNKPDKNGELKEVKEHFICNVDLFCEAETLGLMHYDHQGANTDVTAVSRSGVCEIVNESEKTPDNHYFRATVVKTFVNDDGRETELKYRVLVAADDLTQANEKMLEYMRQGLEDMRLDAVSKTKIIALI